ncbi:hypothetical protein [Microbacterium enclense]|uniref:hypothetical protein n=1 Tax=Microbacterium enclense TaxID=993073 RepID=UPI003F7E6B93
MSTSNAISQRARGIAVAACAQATGDRSVSLRCSCGRPDVEVRVGQELSNGTLGMVKMLFQHAVAEHAVATRILLTVVTPIFVPER